MAKLSGAAKTAWKKKHPALVASWGKNKKKPRKTAHKKGNTMAKKKRKSPRRSGGGKRRRSSSRRGGGGGLFSVSKSELMYAAGGAAAYAYLSAAATEDPAKYEWFTKLPVVHSVGRAATVALIAGVAYKAGVARKYTKPLALGVGAVALVRLAQRRFKLYDGDEGTHALGDGDGDGGGGGYLAGDVDLGSDIGGGEVMVGGGLVPG
jgi:hypothetical protein